MDEEIKQLLREIRDFQREHLEIIRGNVKEAADVNRIALENHTKWRWQTKQYTKWTLIMLVVAVVCLIALEMIKKLR
jgi:hypothetical protein